MFARSYFSRGDPGGGRSPARLAAARKRGLGISLPSPFLLGLICLLVVLPLAWPEGDERSTSPAELASFDLAADVTSASISRDGRLLSAVSRDRPIACWRREDRAWSGFHLPIQHLNGARVLAVSPVEPTLAAGYVDGSVCLWDLRTGQNRATIRAGTDMVAALCFSADGTVLAVVSAESGIQLVDLAKGSLRGELGDCPGTVTALAFFPDGRTLASGGDDGSIRLWDVEHGRQIGRLQGTSQVVLSLAVSPGGCLLASSSLCDRRIRLWDAETLESRGFLATEGATSTCLVFPRDGGPLVSGDDLGNITFWDLALAKPRAGLQAHKGWVKSMAVSHYGQILATGGNDGFVRVWDMEAVLRGHRLPVDR